MGRRGATALQRHVRLRALGWAPRAATAGARSNGQEAGLLAPLGARPAVGLGSQGTAGRALGRAAYQPAGAAPLFDIAVHARPADDLRGHPPAARRAQAGGRAGRAAAGLALVAVDVRA